MFSGLKNPKTTLLALGGFLTELGSALVAQFDGDPVTIANWGTVAAFGFVFAQGLFSRDADKTSKASGAE